jgi:scyllo-inositol 2-dehydrogenase (NADP+)
LNPVFQKAVKRAVGLAAGFKEGNAVNGAVIGYGGAFNMGKCHLDMMNATAGLKGIAACDVDPKRMDAALKEVPGIKTYTDYKEMLKNKDIGLVTVITPHYTHAPIAMDCLNAGKSVILEKPMCITTREATAMIRAAKENNVMLSVFHNRRWDGDYLAIEEVIKKGMIGDVFHIEIFIGGYSHPGFWWRSDKKISGGAL